LRWSGAEGRRNKGYRMKRGITTARNKEVCEGKQSFRGSCVDRTVGKKKSLGVETWGWKRAR